ncbi:MAG: STAS domain-containing protein [Rectinemataceae bacterium]|nr:STAS domain-containing protein [Rectinemataceae bacterium]
MEITKRQFPGFIEFRAQGRLDAQWAGDLDAALATAIRAGARRVRLDMSGIGFMSSAGIRILLKYYKELKAIKGSFGIIDPSVQVRDVLDMAGMLEMLTVIDDVPDIPDVLPAEVPAGGHVTETAAVPSPAHVDAPMRAADSTRTSSLDGGRMTNFPASPGARLSLKLSGDPGLFATSSFGAGDLIPVVASGGTMALGLGAFGSGFDDCREYFGEFLVLGGMAACMPANGSSSGLRLPDYMVARGNFVPTVQTLYAAVCSGEFARFFQFEAEKNDTPLPLSAIADTCLALCGSSRIAVAMLAETTGLVGVSLARPPVTAGDSPPWTFPEARDWFNFTSEPAWPRSLALVTGIMADADDAGMAPFARPFGLPGKIGHFHAAALSYRALPDGRLDLVSTVSGLFESQNLMGLIHLVDDNRPWSGIGQSRFLRGAVWAGALDPEKNGGRG